MIAPAGAPGGSRAIEIRRRLAAPGVDAALGVHRNTILNWRRRTTEPRFSDGMRLAKVIHVDPEILAAFFRGEP